ncbi:TonB-dependent receptor [Methylococcus geothermalis]|uniref:TonB-dependent receptor plug domain-containing protein n=1 Tax=Methylococcus geothermalis TaxID=2681310 RepID=A0A858Q773_9GAMM|nr:TonB-dependent receptor [Methylococcus geothermalis]QJD29645.1 TonB-dependent receptor plug domain-containing protein [Methylococcus geothermalis]
MQARKIITPRRVPKAAAFQDTRYFRGAIQDTRKIWAILCTLGSACPAVGFAHPQPQPPSEAQPQAEPEAQTDARSQTTTPADSKGRPIAKAKAKPKPKKDDDDENDPQLIEEPVSLETVEVVGRETDLIGLTQSASQGVVGQNQFKYRPLLRVGELVEVVPGMLATQHSGTGKANQYFLRGFNLDHGTDFATWVDGVPMNLPTNAHGQGYMDLNSIIPELVDRVEYGKGPYYAEMGDFSAAGYAYMHTKHRLPQGFVNFTGGEYNYYRTVAANSNELGPGDLLYAASVNFYDGPWQRPMDLNQFNGMLRYTIDKQDWGLSVIAKGYNSRWYATNQIPEALVLANQLDLYGTMNRSDGGNTNRYSLSTNLWSRGESSKSEVNLYAAYYDLDLYSDFTYFLEHPQQGDQILQGEHRVYYGGTASQTWFNKLFDTPMENSLGLQIRHDQIGGLELANTQWREVFNIVSRNNVSETSIGMYFKNETFWMEKFKTIAGLRNDIFVFNVDSQLTPLNSGNRNSSMVSPKLSMVFGPWVDTEFFVNMGYGFHSNDARGAVESVNPTNGDPVHAVTPMVRSKGAEIGARSQYIPGLNSTLAFWFLHTASELVFTGDAGTTEPTGPGNRYGVEWANYYQATDWLTLDADLAFTKSYYTDLPSGDNSIPNSVGNVITSGATVQMPYGFWSTLRLRHFSNVPLNEAGTVFLGDTTLVNFGLGWQEENIKLTLDLFNIFDSRANDIAYYYQYRLQNQPPEGVEGKLIHPVEPRMLRGSITISF